MAIVFKNRAEGISNDDDGVALISKRKENAHNSNIMSCERYAYFSWSARNKIEQGDLKNKKLKVQLLWPEKCKKVGLEN